MLPGLALPEDCEELGPAHTGSGEAFSVKREMHPKCKCKDKSESEEYRCKDKPESEGFRCKDEPEGEGCKDKAESEGFSAPLRPSVPRS